LLLAECAVAFCERRHSSIERVDNLSVVMPAK
jgi:hypothetical protein